MGAAPIVRVRGDRGVCRRGVARCESCIDGRMHGGIGAREHDRCIGRDRRRIIARAASHRVRAALHPA